MMTNLACRIFSEQIKLLLSLPNQEEAKSILYQAITENYNQFENQNENQFDNQIANQVILYSDSISELSKSVLNILRKSIIWKEFSNNYGGPRQGAGRKANTTPAEEKETRYGELGLVRLTESQYNKLNQKYGNLNKAIEKLDTWLGTSGSKNKNKNHYGYFKENSWVWNGIGKIIKQDEEVRAKL